MVRSSGFIFRFNGVSVGRRGMRNDMLKECGNALRDALGVSAWS
jgi:hypothetical protein